MKRSVTLALIKLCSMIQSVIRGEKCGDSDQYVLLFITFSEVGKNAMLLSPYLLPNDCFFGFR